MSAFKSLLRTGGVPRNREMLRAGSGHSITGWAEFEWKLTHRAEGSMTGSAEEVGVQESCETALSGLARKPQLAAFDRYHVTEER